MAFDTASEIGDAVRANLEPSYVAYSGGPGLDPLIFEADIAPHFSLFPRRWNSALIFTPKVLLRMFAEPSIPVKTPSYMPRISLFGWLGKGLDRPALYASLTLGHHSNGQTGPSFLPDGSNNHENGDFSTNYFLLSLSRVTRSDMFFGWTSAGLEWHPGFNQSAGLEGRYGLWRAHLASTVARRLILDGSFFVELSVILDEYQASSSSTLGSVLERFPLYVRYTSRIPYMDLGLFVASYVGQDYYNIWFDRVIFALMIGFSGDLWASPHRP